MRVELEGMTGFRTVANEPLTTALKTLGGGLQLEVAQYRNTKTRVTLTFDDLRFIDEVRDLLAREPSE